MGQTAARELTTRIAQRLVRSGDWQRVGGRAYLTAPGTPVPAHLAEAALAYGGPASVLTGRLAASAHALRWVPDAAQAHLLVPGEVRLRATGLVRVRRCAGLAAVGTRELAGLRVAGPARAVFDAALDGMALRDVRGLVLGSVADGRVSTDQLRAVLANEPHNGTALLRRAVRDADRGCASPPEAELVDGLVGCGYPFLVNPELRINGVLLGYPDAWFVGRGCGAEMDSREHHEKDDAFDATLARHDRFGAFGLLLSHLTPRRFRASPRSATAAVLGVVRARSGWIEPRGLEVIPRGPLLR